MNRISGIRNIHICKKVSEGEYDAEVVRMRGAKSLSVKDNKSQITFYSDNVADYNQSKTSSKEIEIEMAYLPIDVVATLTGKQIVEGGLVSTADDLQNPVALMYELTTLEGKSQYHVLYNVKLDIDGSEAKTMEESIDEQNVKLVGTAIVDEQGLFDYMIDANYPPKEEDDLRKFNAKITNWFNAVQMPVSE